MGGHPAIYHHSCDKIRLSQSVEKIYADNTEPTMPILDILPPTRTEHLTMGAILEEESSISGNYNVIDNIFRKQMGQVVLRYCNFQLYL